MIRRLSIAYLVAVLTWGFTLSIGDSTFRVCGFTTRDKCWSVHKTLTDAFPEWILGHCEREPLVRRG